MLRLYAAAAGFFLMSLMLTVAAQEPLQHTKDSLEVVKDNLKTGKAVLLDVREQKEWDSGHLKSARLVPQSKLKLEIGLDELLSTLPKDKVIYTHCRGGNRALACGKILKKQGFEVRPLKTGYQGLVEAGFEKNVEKK